PRRVTWLYQPYPADQAAAKVEAEVTGGQIRRAWATRTRRDETQRERDDRDRAVQSAREEAEGAGVGRITAYVTTTVQHDDDLDAATADVEQRGGQAKLRLRRLRGSQAAGFAAALGIGIDPAELLAHRRGR
ncbi:SCO6880 family protein, partial [Pseudonocardia sp. MH-G8]|uniref:SCO6880 family protein n=1 Tax=Pseudonocardia sp. MH-G8 TaxID=1854588 RepID=UPI000BDC3350